MNKLDDIQNAIKRDRDLIFPQTSDRKMKMKKGTHEFIREQFIDTFNNALDKKADTNEEKINFMYTKPDEYKALLKKVYEKFEDIVSEIYDHMDETEERILRMAKEDYIYKQGLDNDEDEDWDEDEAIEDVDWYDVQDIVFEFIPEEFHHNIKGRYTWADDYFPQSIDRGVLQEHDPWGSFRSRYVDSIGDELDDIFKEFLGLDKKLQDNIRKNYQNIFDFIFEEVDRLNWDFVRLGGSP